MQRRHFLKSLSALGTQAIFSNAFAADAMPRLAAAWDTPDGRHHVGLINIGAFQPSIIASIELPTRAHALLVDGSESIIAVARRPGEWLLRWSPHTGKVQWLWSDPGFRFTGHVILHRSALYTTETDWESGAGLVVKRNYATLESLALWDSGGIDPHQLIVDNDDSLLLANGGIPTTPESGRTKLNLSKMDSSLVRIDSSNGVILGKWQLQDTRLSIRHLARHKSGLVGIALQAEHEQQELRSVAPVLALFDGQTLKLPADMPNLAGYGGSIVACSEKKNIYFAIACPRANGVAYFAQNGSLKQFQPLAKACPLTEADGNLWAGGVGRIIVNSELKATTLPIRLDNHWTHVK